MGESLPTYITVADLRKALDGLPDGMPVIQSSDAEGNSYMPTFDIGVGYCRTGSYDELHPDDFMDGQEYKRAVFLTPA